MATLKKMATFIDAIEWMKKGGKAKCLDDIHENVYFYNEYYDTFGFECESTFFEDTIFTYSQIKSEWKFL